MVLLLSLGIGVFAICVAAIVYYQMTVAAEAKNIPQLLERERKELGKLSFDELVQLVKNEPRKVIKFGATTLIRKLESRKIYSNLANELHVVVKITGTKNPALEHSHVVSQQDKGSRLE